MEEKHGAVISKVKKVLNNNELMKSILEEHPEDFESLSQAIRGKLVDL